MALKSFPVFFGLQACLLAFPGGFPVVSGRLPGYLMRLLPLRLIARVFAVRTGLKTRQVRLFFWNKTPYFGALFLGLRSYSFPKQSAFSSYEETVAAFISSEPLRRTASALASLPKGAQPGSGKLERFLRASIPRREGFALLD